MMRFRFAALGDIAEISAGNPAPQDTSDFSEDGEPFVRMQDVGREHHTRALSQTADKITANAISSNRLRRFPAGTLLIPKSGASINLNHRALLARDAYVVSHLATVIPDTSLLHPDFLYYWSLTYDPRHQAQTTSLPSLPTSLIKAARIPLPPLSEQCRIVDLLGRAEGIVRLRREAQRKAAELIPAIFLDLFGDPATNPRRWPVVALGDISEVQGGLQVTRRRAEIPLERPYLRVANVYRGSLDLSEIKSIRLTEAELRRTRLQRGDLLIVEGHGNAMEVGRVAVWDGSIADCTHQNHLIRVRPDASNAVPAYLEALLNDQSGRDGLMRSGKTTSGLSTISTQNVKDTTVMLPPVDLQHQFAAKAEAVRGIITRQTAALATAQATFDALLHRAFAS